jgi:hypothetical protein
MGLVLEDLNAQTRELMLSEVEADIQAGRLYESANFDAKGRAEYPDLLREAALHGDDDALAAALNRGGDMSEWTQGRRGTKVFPVRVRADAAQMFAEGEFNRFYLRGLCLKAIAESVEWLEIYRAKAVAEPRSESVARIGARIKPAALLADLRAHPGADSALGLPPGPNSGLSARIPKR